MLALCCDYRVMTDGSKRNVWMCMNEVRTQTAWELRDATNICDQVHFGANWPYPFSYIARAKITDAQVLRRVALEGHRFTPQEALKAGLVDHLVQGDTEDVLRKAQEVAVVASGQAQAGAYGLIRVSILISSSQAKRREGH